MDAWHAKPITQRSSTIEKLEPERSDLQILSLADEHLQMGS